MYLRKFFKKIGVVIFWTFYRFESYFLFATISGNYWLRLFKKCLVLEDLFWVFRKMRVKHISCWVIKWNAKVILTIQEESVISEIYLLEWLANSLCNTLILSSSISQLIHLIFSVKICICKISKNVKSLFIYKFALESQLVAQLPNLLKKAEASTKYCQCPFQATKNAYNANQSRFNQKQEKPVISVAPKLVYIS